MHHTYLILRKKPEWFCSVLWWTRLKIFSQRTLIAAGCHFQKFTETVWGPHLHHLPLRLLVFVTDLHSRIKAESRELWVGVWVFYLRKNKLKVPLVDSQITSSLKELGKAPIFPLKKNYPYLFWFTFLLLLWLFTGLILVFILCISPQQYHFRRSLFQFTLAVPKKTWVQGENKTNTLKHRKPHTRKFA